MDPTAAMAAVTAVVVALILGPFVRRALWNIRHDRPWPPLPTKGFVIGRPATPSDVDRGDAIFSCGGRSRILILPLPQYGIYYPGRGRPLRGVVGEAEMVEDEVQMLGLRL